MHTTARCNHCGRSALYLWLSLTELLVLITANALLASFSWRWGRHTMHQLECLGDVHVLEYTDILSPRRSRCAFEESVSNQMATLKPKRILCAGWYRCKSAQCRRKRSHDTSLCDHHDLSKFHCAQVTQNVQQRSTKDKDELWPLWPNPHLVRISVAIPVRISSKIGPLVQHLS